MTGRTTSRPSTDYADYFVCNRRNLCMTFFLFLIVSPIQARADLSQKQTRKVIQMMGGWSLPKDSVRVRSVKSSGTESAEVNAEMELVFRLTLREGHWQLREIRTGQDRWERLDLIAQALRAELPPDRCGGPTLLSSELTTKHARCLVAGLFGIGLPSDEVRIKEISPFGLSIGSESAALVVALVRVDFRLALGAQGWQVAELK